MLDLLTIMSDKVTVKFKIKDDKYDTRKRVMVQPMQVSNDARNKKIVAY